MIDAGKKMKTLKQLLDLGPGRIAVQLNSYAEFPQGAGVFLPVLRDDLECAEVARYFKWLSRYAAG